MVHLVLMQATLLLPRREVTKEARKFAMKDAKFLGNWSLVDIHVHELWRSDEAGSTPVARQKGFRSMKCECGRPLPAATITAL